MAFVTGDVVAVTGEELPFKVVFMQGETVLAEWLVESKEDGEGQIVETLKSLVEDDELEDGRAELEQNRPECPPEARALATFSSKARGRDFDLGHSASAPLVMRTK